MIRQHKASQISAVAGRLTTVLVSMFIATTSQASLINFSGSLSGDQEVPPVETDASGIGTLSVDTTSETLDFSLSVSGISFDELFDTLVEAPVGPVHLHNGASGVNAGIVVPFPFDTGYSELTEEEGFLLSVEDYAFADAAAISGSDVSFDDFLTGLYDEGFYINVHSDVFGGGEIRGQLALDEVAAEIPAPAPLLLLGLGLVPLLLKRRGR